MSQVPVSARPDPAGPALASRPVPGWLRSCYHCQISLLVIWPLMPSFGRMLLGSGGWMTLFALFYMLPFLLCAHGLILVLTRARARRVGCDAMGAVTGAFYLVYVVSFFVLCLAMPDASDASATPSVLGWAGLSASVSNGIAFAALVLSAVCLAGCLVAAVTGLVLAVRHGSHTTAPGRLPPRDARG